MYVIASIDHFDLVFMGYKTKQTVQLKLSDRINQMEPDLQCSECQEEGKALHGAFRYNFV